MSMLKKRSVANIKDGRYVKKVPNNRDISPVHLQEGELFGPPDIEELKKRVRDEIKALDTKTYNL